MLNRKLLAVFLVMLVCSVVVGCAESIPPTPTPFLVPNSIDDEQREDTISLVQELGEVFRQIDAISNPTAQEIRIILKSLPQLNDTYPKADTNLKAFVDETDSLFTEMVNYTEALENQPSALEGLLTALIVTRFAGPKAGESASDDYFDGKLTLSQEEQRLKKWKTEWENHGDALVDFLAKYYVDEFYSDDQKTIQSPQINNSLEENVNIQSAEMVEVTLTVVTPTSSPTLSKTFTLTLPTSTATLDAVAATQTPRAAATLRPRSTFSCSGAPTTRLRVGSRARVTYTDGTANSIRDEPASAYIFGKAPEGTGMDIVGGPICSNQRVWWHVKTDNNLEGWTAEGKPGDYWLEPHP